MGSKTATQTQFTSSEPWAKAQPSLEKGFNAANSLYDSGTGFNAYQGDTVVPFSRQTQTALTGIENQANQGNILGSAANNNALGVISSGGMNPMQTSALGGVFDTAIGGKPITAAADYLTDTASGKYLENGNPYFNARVDREAGKIADDVNRSFSLGGRYGSDSHVGALGEAIGNFRNDALASDFTRERGMQMQAAGALGQEQAANIANQVGAGQAYFDAGDTAARTAGTYSAMAPGIYDQLYAPFQKMMAAGGAYEDLTGRQYQADINKFNDAQQAPWTRLSNFMGIASGGGALGGTSTQTAQVPQNSAFTNALGGGLAGAGMYGALGGAALGPWGLALPAAGALGGALFG